MIDWKKKLEAQFDFVKENIQDVKHVKTNGKFVATYYFFDKEYKLEISGGVINNDFNVIDFIAYSFIIDGNL